MLHDELGSIYRMCDQAGKAPMNYHRQHKPNSEALKDRGEREIPPFTPTTTPLMKLHSTIGNRAMQQMLAGDMVQTAIQRKDKNAKPDNKPKSDSSPRQNPAALLTIERSGTRFKGECAISSHEGKIEALSFQVIGSRNLGSSSRGAKADKGKNEEPQPVEAVITKYLDSTSEALAQEVVASERMKLKAEIGTLGSDGKFTTLSTTEAYAFVDNRSVSSIGERPIEALYLTLIDPKYSMDKSGQ